MTSCAGIYPGPDQLPGLGWSVTREPLTPMRAQRAVAGNEWRGLDYAFPLRRWTLTYEFLREQWPSDLGGPHSELSILLGFFGFALGAGKCFCFFDPEDNYATGAQMLMLNSWALAVGDNSTVSFQLARPIVPNQADNSEPIKAPYTLDQVYLNGAPAALSGFSWTLDDTAGIVTFNNPPGMGSIVTADFGYYWRTRFVEDSLPFEQFMLRLWSQKKVQLITCLEKPPLPPPPALATHYNDAMSLAPFAMTGTATTVLIAGWIGNLTD